MSLIAYVDGSSVIRFLSISSSCFNCRSQFSHHSCLNFSRQSALHDAILVVAAVSSDWSNEILLASSSVKTETCSFIPRDSLNAHSAPLTVAVWSLIMWPWCALICSIGIIIPLSSMKNMAAHWSSLNDHLEIFCLALQVRKFPFNHLRSRCSSWQLQWLSSILPLNVGNWVDICHQQVCLSPRLTSTIQAHTNWFSELRHYPRYYLGRTSTVIPTSTPKTLHTCIIIIKVLIILLCYSFIRVIKCMLENFGLKSSRSILILNL